VDPDPYQKPGSGSRGKKVKKFHRKNALFSFFLILPLKRYKIAQTTFCKKNLVNNTGIIDLIWLKFWFKKKKKNCLRKFCFSLDPEPDPELDPDPDW
jgi:hypothetical protein